MKELQITVDFGKARSKERAGTRVDIAALLSDIPTAEIMAGDPRVSLQVRIDEQDHNRLIAAVGDYCIVEDYVDLDLYGGVQAVRR